MFRKPVHLSGEHAVSGADRKKLRRALQAAFGASDAALDAVLPPKCDLRIAKVASPSRASVYTADGAPVLVDVSSKGDWLPTIFALWRAPDLLPVITLKHADVAHFLLGGADLMLPGVAMHTTQLAQLREGRLAAVCVPHNPAPLAVGEVALSGDKAAAAGGKGRLLTVLHVYRDCLWELAPPHAATPNAGFQRDAVRSLQPEAQGEADVQDDWEDAAEDATADALAAVALSGGEVQTPDAAASAEAVTEAVLELPSAAETDALMDAALLQALRTRVRDADLPLPASTLWAAHVLPSRPAGAHVDVRRSSHKKVGRFVAAKQQEGLLTSREDKHTGELLVTGVNRRHPALLAHEPHATEAEAGAAADEAAAADAPLPPGAPPPPPLPLHIEELVLPSAATKPIFAAVGSVPPDAAMRDAEALAALGAYVASFCAAPASHPSRVLLDPPLCDAVFKGALRKGEAAPTEVSRSELGPLFLARCAHVRRVYRAAAPAPPGAPPPAPLQRGALPPLALTLASRAGGKKVTLARGLEAYLVDAEALAAQLRARFAASCAVAELPRAEGSAPSRAPLPRECVLQGDRAAQVAELLEREWHVPRRCISLPAGATKKKG